VDAAESGGIREIERLVGVLEASDDREATREARDLVRGVLSFHRAALDKALSIVRAAQRGPDIVEALAEDELVASLLVLHGLHPRSIERRAELVADRLAREHPSLRLVGVTEGIVQLEMRSSGAAALLTRRVVEAAIVEALPDALGVTFVDEPPLVQLRKKGT